MKKHAQRGPQPGADAPGPAPSTGLEQDRGNSAAQDTLKQDKTSDGAPLKNRMQGTPSPLPYRAEAEAAFGEDLGEVMAWLGEGDALGGLGASAAASGHIIAFEDPDPPKDQVFREVAHVIQERRHGPGAAGQTSDTSDSAEQESRQSGAASSGGAATGQARPSAEIQLDEHDTWQEARRRALEIKDALLDHWTEDEQKALNQIRGQSPLMVREIAAQYREITGRNLQNDFQDKCSESEWREALAIMWGALSLYDQLRSNVDRGFLWNSADEEGMLDVIRHASRTSLDAAANDQRVLGLLRENLNDDEYYQARKLIQPDDLLPVVIERIGNAPSWWNDDEDAVYDALLDLSASQRRELWTTHEDLFSFMSSGQKQSTRDMCMGTEAEALSERMDLATWGWGTQDEGVAATVDATQRAVQEERSLQAILTSGLAPDGTPLTDDQRSRIEARLAEIGGVSAMVTPERDAGGELSSNTFLQNLHGDVGDDQFQAMSAQMGVDTYELVKQQILDAIGTWSHDERSVQAAFERLVGQIELPQGTEMESLTEAQRASYQERANRELRMRLYNDPDVLAELDRLGVVDRLYVDDYANADTYTIALNELKYAFEGMTIDMPRIFEIVGGMSSADRSKMMRDQPSTWTRITGSVWTSQEELDMLLELARTGRLPTQMGLDWAMGGDWDGTSTEMMAQTFAIMTDAERAQYRLGYWLQREGQTPQDETAQAALDAFTALYARMEGELGGDDMQSAMDQLIGLPTAQELQTEEGRLLAAGIIHHRANDRQAMGSGMADAFMDQDETRDAANVQLQSAYAQAMEDGNITGDELAVLAALDANFAKRYTQHVQAVDMVRGIASTVAAIAVGILVTVISGGTAGPAVGGLLAQYGAAALAGGVAGAAAKVGTSELMAGDHYDTFSTEGARDAATGFADGATAVLSAGLAARFSGMVGLGQGALASSMAAGALDSTGAALSYAGKAFAGGALRGSIEGFLAGAVGELVLTMTDANIWRQSVWDVVCSAGLAILRGGGIGMATGGVMGGTFEALGAFVQARRMPGLIDDMELAGIARADLEEMSVDVVEAIGRADAAMAAGNADEVDRIFGTLSHRLDADTVARLRSALNDSHNFMPQGMDDYAARVAQLADGGQFDESMYHGTNSDMLDGLESTDGQILSAEDLHQRGVAQSTGEGDAFSGASGRKDFVSVGNADSGLGTSLAYASAGEVNPHYNVQLYTVDQLEGEIRRLETIVNNWDSIQVDLDGGMGRYFKKDLGQFESQLDKLTDELDFRMTLPDSSPRRIGGVGNAENYPVLFEFDGEGLNFRARGDVAEGGRLGGEGWVYDPIDLRTRLTRAYAPEANVEDLHRRLRGILGHDSFEIIPLEAMSALPAGNSASANQATGELLTELDQGFRAAQMAYEEAARTGEAVDVTSVLEHLGEIRGD